MHFRNFVNGISQFLVRYRIIYRQDIIHHGLFINPVIDFICHHLYGSAEPVAVVVVVAVDENGGAINLRPDVELPEQTETAPSQSGSHNKTGDLEYTHQEQKGAKQVGK